MTYRAEPWLTPLKPFQRATVDTVFERYFTDPDPTSRFLVADEAGLGKTMVARGVIARMVERLQHEKERMTIVYLCSSQSIARQNLESLNVVGGEVRPLNTRPTLLPFKTRGTGMLELLSLTPGTALDLKSSGGRADERALIYAMLRDRIGPRRSSALRFFRGGSGPAGWPDYVRWQREKFDYCPDHAADFNAVVGDDIIDLIRESSDFRRHDPSPDYPVHLRPGPVIGDLRRRLARIGLRRLDPDLVVIDEFQRFADLLHDHDAGTAPAKAEAAELAQTLFARESKKVISPRILLLSATPYRMVTLKSDAEEEGDHYADFIKTMAFLFDEPETGLRTTALKAALKEFRVAMQGLPESAPAAIAVKNRVETALRTVMSRTERVAATVDRDALIRSLEPTVTIRQEDLKEARAVSRIAQALDAPGIIEYWKSSPYLLSFMRDYKMARALRDRIENPSRVLHDSLKNARSLTLPRNRIRNYGPVPARNGRMRALERIVFEEGLGRALWVPPCRPSFGEMRAATKTLVFSDWSMVPDAIAALLSHEASREMGVEKYEPSSTSKIETMLPMLYPCIALAQYVDPLQMEAFRGHASSLEEWRAQARDTILDRFNAYDLARIVPTERLTALRLDRVCGKGIDWMDVDNDTSDAVRAIRDAAGRPPGRPEGDTGRSDLLVDLALGSPATCALRSLMRVAPTLAPDDPALSMAALRIALAFRSLFDQPESSCLLADGGGSYWRRILAWCTAHDLPAVLDEYTHLLSDAHANETDDALRIGRIAESMAEAIALRPAEITVNRFAVESGKLALKPESMRARFAMRFATDAENDKGIKRTGLVQAAFKSPFRPFVLATTSIGQEGLDFHSYCARVVHWNLPRNPVDIEQREGRVHRFKNHCVRHNLAAAQGATALPSSDDPWCQMFDAAMQQEQAAGRSGDLVPFWMHDGNRRIERVVLLPPMSREVRRYARLIRSLATYRLAFGQPRQMELLELFDSMSDVDHIDLADFQINLRPRPI